MNICVVLVFMVVTAVLSLTNQTKRSEGKPGIYYCEDSTPPPTRISEPCHPHQVSLQVYTNGHWHHYCGGSILGREKVLTSAYCAERHHFFRDKWQMNRVVAGVNNISLPDANENTRQFGSIKKVSIHPGYDSNSNLDYDYAILLMDTDWEFNRFVYSIALPHETEVAEGECVTTGWGEESKTRLGQINLTMVPSHRCKSSYGHLLTDQMICASANYESRSVCYMDAGGPLVCKGTLTGVASWAKTPCTSSYPGVFSDVAAAVKWIKSM